MGAVDNAIAHNHQLKVPSKKPENRDEFFNMIEHMNSKSSRLKNLLMTTGMSLVVQLLAGISGLILPVYIMKTFGSSVNGLVTSITQFLAVITFLDLGVGAVVQSSLYKPLAEKDKNQLSMIVLSAERFYRRIAILFLIYVACLTVVYPFIHIKTYSWIFTASLMLILAIGNFAQYYFGITSGGNG